MPSRRQLLATVGALVSFGISGCLLISPTVRTDTSDSAVFTRFAAAESWSSDQVRTNVRLTRNATRRLGITRLVVLTESGRVFHTTSIAAGQTSATVMFPPNKNATVVAANSTGYAIDNQTVTVTGTEFF